MGRPAGSKNKIQKDKFSKLSPEFKEKVEALGNDEAAARALIAQVALNNAALHEAQEADEDLAQKKEQVKCAMEGYSPAYEAFKLQIEFIRAHLDSNGKGTGDSHPGTTENN